MSLDLPDGFISGLPNCGITAIAAATGANYADVWEWFRTRNKHRASWRGRTNHKDYLPALYHFGCKKSGPYLHGKGASLQKFTDLHTRPGETYLIRMSGHVVVVRDGLVLDNISKAATPAAEHPKARCIVKNAWRVTA